MARARGPQAPRAPAPRAACRAPRAAGEAGAPAAAPCAAHRARAGTSHSSGRPRCGWRREARGRGRARRATRPAGAARAAAAAAALRLRRRSRRRRPGRSPLALAAPRGAAGDRPAMGLARPVVDPERAHLAGVARQREIVAGAEATADLRQRAVDDAADGLRDEDLGDRRLCAALAGERGGATADQPAAWPRRRSPSPPRAPAPCPARAAAGRRPRARRRDRARCRARAAPGGQRMQCVRRAGASRTCA